jgi:hypothetical protein
MQAHRWILIAALSCAPLWPQADKVDWAALPVIDAKPRFERVEIKPGEQQQFQIASHAARVGSTEALPYTKPHGTVTWSIEPAGAGVTVNARGTVAASATAKPGKYILTVRIGSEWYKNDFVVYDPQAVQLKGNWTEKATLSCDGREVPPAAPLRELIFHADGDFSATWLPFETRQDYWGTYTYDVKSQKLVLRPERGNYLPTDITPEGKALIDKAGRLVVSGARFGTPPNSALRGGKASPSCGSIFVRQ